MGCITLTGDNDYLIDKFVKDKVNNFTRNHGDLGIERLDAEILPAEEVILRTGIGSLFAQYKLVVIRKLAANKELLEHVEELLTAGGEAAELLIVEPKLDRRSRAFKILKDKTEYRQLDVLNTSPLINWLIEEAKAAGGGLNRDDARYLIDRVGTNQLLLENELKKLVLFDAGISRKSIDLLVEPSPQSTVFDLINAAINGNRQRAIKIYKEQRFLKVEPLQIIGMMTWQLHLVAAIKSANNKSDYDIGRDLGVNPNAVEHSRHIAARLSQSELTDNAIRLLKLDVLFKSKAVSADDALLEYLLSF